MAPAWFASVIFRMMDRQGSPVIGLKHQRDIAKSNVCFLLWWLQRYLAFSMFVNSDRC